jgi:anaerobic magnesium-protoporphyrin IX monomethyl ester cyclase
MKQLDVVLVNPGHRSAIYQGLAAELTAIENPVWAGLIASFARQCGHSAVIIDANAAGLSAEETAAQADELNPRLVAVVVYGHQPSASTQNMTGASAVCTAIKARRPDLPVLMVGGHVAALPVRTLTEEACDFVASDEGLSTLVELLEALRSGSTDLTRVSGLVYRAEGRVVSNRAAPLLKDLDIRMPGVSWDLLPMGNYRAHNWHCFGGLDRQPYAAIYTTLGCPYRCSFCCIQAPFKAGEKAAGLTGDVNTYRFWSPARVLDEIDVLVHEYGVRNLKFADEMFVLHQQHVAAICDGIIERGYDLNIWAYARVDTVGERTMDKLKAAGFNWLALGIEAGSERVLADVNKRYSLELVHATVERLRAAGINIIGNFIFGLPEDDLDSMQRTLDTALALRCEFANFYSAMAYPGSALYKQALEFGWKLPGTWSGYSQHSVDTLPLPTRHLPAGTVLRFRDEAFRTYFTNVDYLESIRQKFGPATVEHIRAMTKHNLSRRYVDS